MVYLEDIIIFSKSIDEYLQHIKLVLTKLADAGFSLKLKKCYFLQSKVDYLGHIVSPEKLAVESKTCNAVQQMHEPNNLTELRSFLRLCNVFRRFVENFARIAHPLTQRLRRGCPSLFVASSLCLRSQA